MKKNVCEEANRMEGTEAKAQKSVHAEDICVCCGAPVPEGRMICWSCEHS